MTEATLKNTTYGMIQVQDTEENYEDSKEAVVARSWEGGSGERTGKSQRLLEQLKLL